MGRQGSNFILHAVCLREERSYVIRKATVLETAPVASDATVEGWLMGRTNDRKSKVQS